MMEYITNVARYETEDGDKILYPFSPPIFQTHIDDHFRIELLEEGRKLTKEEDDFNHKLAGNLKYGRSYHYKEDYVDKVEPKIISYCEKFLNGITDQFQTSKSVDDLLQKQVIRGTRVRGKLRLDTFWVNFSKKHDYNPPHTHTGVLSFVIFLHTPPEIFKVQADSNTQRAGQITFAHGNNMTDLMGAEYPVTPYENLMFIFPNKLSHYVAPFWVDEERVSVSGNLIVV